MSYALSDALQAALYARLAGDAALGALAGAHIYDALPEGTLPALYVALGSEKVRDASDMGAQGAWHDVSVLVASDAAGFQSAKRTAGAVCDALLATEPPMTLSRGRLVGMTFLRAEAKRPPEGGRLIEMIFRARVDDE